jgi:hypothetical protein
MRRLVWPKMSPSSPTRRATLGGLAALAACDRDMPNTPIVDGQSQRYDLPNGGSAWLSRFNIATTAIDHIALDAPTKSMPVGLYFPSSGSGEFTRLDAASVLGNYRAAHEDKAQALINCSFFERYDAVTELSFPIKRAGRILTGGSSPYGPCKTPRDPRYRQVKLKALVWNDRAINVVDYDHVTGGILNDPIFPDALVTYDYRDHPATVLAGDPVGQYQLMGTFPTRDGGLPDVLFVLTIVKGRMADGAALLKRNGVAGTILTVDGGPSTHLWHHKAGSVITTESKSLPHYLGFRARS